jgi:hypothetical protein
MRVRSIDFSTEMTNALGAAPVVYPRGYVKGPLQDNDEDSRDVYND